MAMIREVTTTMVNTDTASTTDDFGFLCRLAIGQPVFLLLPLVAQSDIILTSVCSSAHMLNIYDCYDGISNAIYISATALNTRTGSDWCLQFDYMCTGALH